MDVATLDVEIPDVPNECPEILHSCVRIGRKSEVISPDDTIAPAGNKPFDGIADESKLEVVAVRGRAVVAEDGVLHGKRNTGLPQHVEDRACPRLGHAEPDKTRTAPDGEIVAELRRIQP